MNRTRKAEHEALILEAKRLVAMDGMVCTNFDEVKQTLQNRYGISRERASVAVGNAVLRIRGELVRERNGIR